MSETMNNPVSNNVPTVNAAEMTAVNVNKPKRKLKPWIKWAAGGVGVVAIGTVILVCLAKGKKPPTEVVQALPKAAETVAQAAQAAPVA